MAKQIYANSASSLLAASIDDTDLTIQVDAGYGALFPNPGVGEFFTVTLINSAGEFEIVKIESRSTDLLTVAAGGRGQEGTSAEAWTNGQTRVEVRATKGAFDRFLQREGDVMEGDLDMDNNSIIDARLSGDTVVVGGQLVGTKIRGIEDNSTNEIDVPSDGTRATAGGERILVETDTDEIRAAAFVVGQVLLWYGALINIPDGWALCNGSGGTPDLRNKFVVGAGDTYALSATGGAISGTTSASGAHDHGGETDGHALTSDENGPHVHNVGGNAIALLGGGTIDGGDDIQATPATITGESSGLGTPHTHDITAALDHTHTVATLPPYYGLYYIMFTG